MALFDFMLSLIGLLLWLNWLSIQFDPLTRSRAASLLGTLKKAGAPGPKRWKYLAGLVTLLFARAWIYWQASPAITWTPKLELGIVALSFRDDYLIHMLLFSLLGFAAMLAAFYLSLLLLSVANRRLPDTDPLQKLVRLHCRWLEPWPTPLKLVFPLLLGGLSWLALHPLLVRLDIAPGAKSILQLFEQAALIGVGAYLAWKYLIIGVLLVHLVNSYVYLGNHPVWAFVDATARNLLLPLRWLPLRIGKVDLLPLVAAILVLVLAEFLSHPARWVPGLILPF